ncbi:MAG: hypothetical protein ABIV11_06295 [Gemmatimonadaceae bacterium]
MIDRRRRRGFALVLAILAVVLIGALIVATHAAVQLEHRVAASAIDRHRAFAASEYALWSAVAGWDGANASLPVGGWNMRTVRVAGDSASIATVRLNGAVFWVAAEAKVGDPERRARRRTAVNVRVSVDSAGPVVTPVPRSWAELH